MLNTFSRVLKQIQVVMFLFLCPLVMLRNKLGWIWHLLDLASRVSGSHFRFKVLPSMVLHSLGQNKKTDTKSVKEQSI